MKKAFRINNIERFLLCENPLRNKNEQLNRLFILHTRKPEILIQIHWMDDLREALDLTSSDICNVSTLLNYEDGTEVELIFRAIFIWDESVTKKDIEPIVKRAIDWYLQILKSE